MRPRHPIYIERNAFTYVRNTLEGDERTFEDMTVEKIRAAGLSPNELVLRKDFYTKTTPRQGAIVSNACAPTGECVGVLTSST